MLYATTLSGSLGAAGDPFKCGPIPGTTIFVCIPTSASVKNAVVNMQRAADAMINKLPFFITWTNEQGKPQTFKVDPIGTSGAGYDGKVGPTTANMVSKVALIGAIELRNQVGELGQVSPTLLSIAKETDEKLMVQKVALNASEIAGFLVAATAEFDALMAEIKERNQPAPPVILQPAPVDRGLGLKIPPNVQGNLTGLKRSFPTLAVVGMATAALFGVGLYSMKKHRDEASAGEMMGAGRRRRR